MRPHRAIVLAALLACSGRVLEPSTTPDAATPAALEDAALPVDSAPPDPCAARAAALREAVPASFNDNPVDPLGYVPFAEDGCGLLYVSGADRKLYRLAFDTGARDLVETELSRPSRPSARDGLAAWEAVEPGGRGVVRVRAPGQAPITIPGSYTRAFEPRVGVDAVIYTFTTGDPEREDADLDVAIFTPSTRTVHVLGDGPGQQRFGALAAGRAAYADFSEDPTGTFSLTAARAADVVVVDLATLARTTRRAEGKQAFPQLSDEGLVLYVDFGAGHPEPKLTRYSVKVGRADGPPSADRAVHDAPSLGSSTPWLQPALRDGVVAWIEDDRTLMRRPASLATPASRVSTSATGFVGVTDGRYASYVAARSAAAGQVFVEGRAR